LLTNVAKHAGASQATVTVDLTPATTSPATPASTALQIAVSDNGHGGASIHPTSNDGRHTGLAGLADRVAAIDGSLTITSPIGGPTAVTLTLPVALIPASSAHV
ncbi:MAG: hypothetical protein LBB54_03335, partial [Cellulomonadaceae bacterium]|nr:hypothetical protein [Cellulomonadaceae bacterium]